MKNPLSLDAFIDWLEKQPAEREYDWWCPLSCLLAQYAKHIGFRHYCELPLTALTSWENAVARPRPHNFGAALGRARAVRDKEVVQ